MSAYIRLATVESVRENRVTFTTKWDLVAIYPDLKVDFVNPETGESMCDLNTLEYPVVVEVPAAGTDYDERTITIDYDIDDDVHAGDYMVIAPKEEPSFKNIFNDPSLLQEKYRKQLRAHSRRLWQPIPPGDPSLEGSKLVGALRAGLSGSAPEHHYRWTGLYPQPWYKRLWHWLLVKLRVRKTYKIVPTWHYHKIRVDWPLEEETKDD